MQPSILYHGTPLIESAFDILLNNRWKQGTCGVHFCSDFDYSKEFCGASGAVVEVIVHSYEALRRTSDIVWCVSMPVSSGSYLRIAGIKPIRLFDYNKNLISSEGENYGIGIFC